MASKKASTVNIKATVNLSTGTVHASKSALRAAGLQPNAKDKGVMAKGFTKKDGDVVADYRVYSVLDATPLAKEVKVTKKASKADYDAMKSLLDNPEALEVLKALLAGK